MSINERYLHLECITRMNPSDLSDFKKLVDFYGSKLNSKNPKSNTLFTLHNFNHHCYDLFRIVSENLLVSPNAYENYGITKHELYLLNLSILFHDISMAVDIHFKRKGHAQQSAEYLRNQFKEDTVLRSVQSLSDNDITALEQIISAHSDDEDGNRIVVEPEMYSSDGKVRANLLAAILRFADELDITSERIGNDLFHKQLVTSDKEENYSKECWEKLNIFSKIENSSYNKIELHTNDKYIINKIEMGDLKTLTDLIMEVEHKINSEFKYFREAIEKAPAKNGVVKSFILVDEFTISSNVDDFKVAFQHEKESLRLGLRVPEYGVLNTARTDLDCGDNDCVFQNKKDNVPAVIGTLSKNIANWIIERDLFYTGHYEINDKYCSRDWIDTREIIETNEYSDVIVKEIIEHIYEKQSLNDNITVLGLNVGGTLLASRVAFQLKSPFSYVIPKTDQSISDEHDKQIKVGDDSKYIIITDAVSTWNTIRSVLNEHHIEDGRVESIYTLLYRKPRNPEIKCTDVLKALTYPLNNDFEIELSEKNTCRWIENCRAHNKAKRK